MSSMTSSTQPLYPTTGEPVSVNARRNRLGLWLCIASDAAGTISLLIAYSYLWSLNVNSAWAPPHKAWASDLPFWLITLGIAIAAFLMWWGYRGLKAGHMGRWYAGATLSSLIVLVTFVGQIVQLSTFPFSIDEGAYATATFWLAIGAAIHLALVLFIAPAMIMRTRAGRITPDNPSHARFVAMWMTWVTIAIMAGAIFTLVMKESPNTNAPQFGSFTQQQ